MRVDGQKIVAFARRYVVISALSVSGWEAARFSHGHAFGYADFVEAVSLFVGISILAVVSVSIYPGWIEFGSTA